MKAILSTFVLAITIAASPASARLSQPGNPNSSIVADVAPRHSAPLVAALTRLNQAGNPSSTLIAVAPRPMAAMMACDCPATTPSNGG